MGYKYFLALCSISLLFGSCSSSKHIHQEMTARQATINYLIEEPETISKTGQTIFLEIDTTFSYHMDSSRVEKISGRFLPFIFYYQLKRNHAYHIDRQALKEDPIEFLHSGFLREAQRNCHFHFTDDESSADYVLVLRLDSIGSKVISRSKAEMYFIPIGPYIISVSTQEMHLSQGSAYTSVSYDLYQRDKGRVKSARTRAAHEIPDYDAMGIHLLWKNRYTSTHAAMAEALSQSYRENFQAVINDLNTLQSEEPDVRKELHDLILDEL